MSLDLYVIKDGKNLRCGYTTGSCATAAAKAAAKMLETGKKVNYIEIETPAGIDLKLPISDINIGNESVSCSVVKDAGDDPDATDGMKIFAKVEKRYDKKVMIDGGLGVGRITAKSFFGEVGQAAINQVPRKMIKKEIQKISKNGYDVTIYCPEGEIIAKKTFNKNIGIEGGISIIGTKGIVYPMSEEALLKTIYLEVDTIAKNRGIGKILLTPGNHGEKLADSMDIKIPRVKISNYVGDSLLYIYEKGFRSIKLLGHIGKFSKLAIGIFNTHSNISDTRMESFVYYLSKTDASREFIEKIESTLTAEEAMNLCIDAGYGQVIRDMEIGAEKRVKTYLKDESLDIEVIIYSMERGRYIC